MKTYVLIVVHPKSDQQQIACRLQKIEEVKEINEVVGFVNLMVEIETESLAQVSDVVGRIRKDCDVAMTFSLVAVYPVKRRKRKDKP